VEIEPEYAEGRPGDVPHSQASIDRARAELGYEPIVSTADGLRETLAWFEQRAVEARA
jgi:nucleoside-diphosphate-sugar epimerase